MKKRVIAMLLMLTLCVSGMLVPTYASGEVNGYVPTIDATLKNGSTVVLLQGYFLDYVSNYTRYGSEATYDGTDQYAPAPVTLSWSCGAADYYTVKLSLDPALTASEYFVTFDQRLVLEDLLMGKTYYYQVIAHRGDTAVKSRIFSFQTAYLTRTIEVPGVSNTRDFGGYLTEDGKHRIRQGLIYRGGQLEEISVDGIEKMLYTYGIKTDLDLRGYTASPLGKTVNYVGVSAPYYLGSNGILAESYKEALITEIRTFADPANYPIYVHCALGRDRTGTLCFLINALCGVGESDLYMDYEASFFSVKGCQDNNTPRHMIDASFTPLFDYINTYPCAGENPTLADRTEAFFKEYLGITQAEIDSIRSILLKDADVAGVTSTQNVTLMSGKHSAPSEFMCDTSAALKDEHYIRFGSTTLTRLTAEEAAVAGVPAGYTGDVLVAENTTNTSIDFLMDFTSQKIPYSLLKSMTFRVWVADDGVSDNDYPELRIIKPGNVHWVMRYDVHAKANQWVDVTLEANGENFESGYDFSDLSEDGKTLGKFGLMVRSNVRVPFYIDSISYTLEENTTPPVLDPLVAKTLHIPEGALLSAFLNIGAFDPEEGALAIQHEWNDPAAENADGTVNRGEYTLTVFAVDYFGNRTEETLTVIVGDADTEPPVIEINTDTIRTVAGAYSRLEKTFSVNEYATLAVQWSVGAFDAYGRLTAGEHTLAITATDFSGNSAQKLVTVVATATEDWGANVIDENDPPKPASPPQTSAPSEEADDVDQAPPQGEDSSVKPLGWIMIGAASGAVLTALAFTLLCQLRKRNKDQEAI